MIAQNFDLKTIRGSILLVNPPVYDLSDFKLEYCQPTGLLKLATVLREQGNSVELIDCLEDISESGVHSAFSKDGYIRNRYHFGMSFNELEAHLCGLRTAPNYVFVTTLATYWYDSTRDTIRTIRRAFPETTVVAGGIYPTLMPDHAKEHLGADVVVGGEVDCAKDARVCQKLYDKPRYIGLQPTRGCPHHCAYCAQQAINRGEMRYRPAHGIVDEIEEASRNGIEQVFFFSENFLFNRSYIMDLLERISRHNIGIRLGAPKGMEPMLLDYELLSLMKSAGWKGIRLALETKSDSHRRALNRWRNTADQYAKAIEYVRMAGYGADELGTFLLYGTPGEDIESVLETANFIHSMGSCIIPMAFTPVPGSAIYSKLIGQLVTAEPTLLLGHMYPFAEYNGYSFGDYLSVEQHIAALNQDHARRVVGMQGESVDLFGLGSFVKSELALAMGA